MSVDKSTGGGGGWGQRLDMSSTYYRNFCAGIFWPVHLLEALIGRMLCTSCIFVMVVELTLTTFFLAVFGHLWLFTCACFSNCPGVGGMIFFLGGADPSVCKAGYSRHFLESGHRTHMIHWIPGKTRAQDGGMIIVSEGH